VREEGGPLGVGKGRSQIKRILGCGRNKKNVEVQEMRRAILWRTLKIFMESVTAE